MPRSPGVSAERLGVSLAWACSSEFGRWTLAYGLITHSACVALVLVLFRFDVAFVLAGGASRCPTRCRSTAPTAATCVVSEPVSVSPARFVVVAWIVGIMLDGYVSFAHAHEAVTHVWGVLMLAGVGATCLSVGCVLIMGSPEVWIRPIRNPDGSWKLGFFCQESGVGQCYVEYLMRQGSSHRRYFLAQLLERYIHAYPDMHKFAEGVGQAAFIGSGLTRVSKADRRAGRFSGPSVFGTWTVASYPFRWQSEYVRRSIGAPGLPPAFVVPPAGVQIFSDTRHGYDELPREIRTAHRDEVRKARSTYGSGRRRSGSGFGSGYRWSGFGSERHGA